MLRAQKLPRSRERESERERVCVCVREREIECVCVCVRERERERERERARETLPKKDDLRRNPGRRDAAGPQAGGLHATANSRPTMSFYSFHLRILKYTR